VTFSEYLPICGQIHFIHVALKSNWKQMEHSEETEENLSISKKSRESFSLARYDLIKNEPYANADYMKKI
jgi:hypothetical protein